MDPSCLQWDAMTRRAWLMMAAAAALWGASYMFIKVALDDLSEGAIVCIRVALGAAVLLPLAARAGALGGLRGRWTWLTVVALVQVTVPFLLITFGENHVPSALAGILVASAPIFTSLLAVAFDHAEQMRGWAGAGVVVGIVGVALLFGVDLSGDGDAIAGGLMILLASLGYAAGAMLIKHRLRGIAPVAVAGSNMAVAAVVTLPLLIASPPTAVPGTDTILSMLVLGAGGTGIAFLWFYTLIAELGPSRASIIAYIAPAFSVLYGALLLDEAVTAGTVAGLALILAGSWLAVSGPKSHPPARAGRDLSRSEPSRSTAPEPARAR
jgi:drug/metabolite transporter (DMT)-like permease